MGVEELTNCLDMAQCNDESRSCFILSENTFCNEFWQFYSSCIGQNPALGILMNEDDFMNTCSNDAD